MLIKEQELLKLIEEETMKALQEGPLIEQARWKIPDDNKYEYSLTPDGKGYIAYENGKALGTFTDEAGLKRVKDAAPQSVKSKASPESPDQDQEESQSWTSWLKKKIGLEDETGDKEIESPAKSEKDEPPGMAAAILKFLSNLVPQNSIIATIGINTMPLWVANFALFLLMKRDKLIVTPDEYRRAAYYIGKYLKAKGAKTIYSYKIYYEAQKLDPKYKSSPEPVYTMNWSKKSSNPYVHLSAAIGKAMITYGDNGSSVITDVYDFNILRGGGEKVEDYVLSLSNFSKGMRKAYDLFGQDRLFAGVEELCVWYELTTGYKGFPLVLQSMTKQEVESVG